jgi:hypothetical protein
MNTADLIAVLDRFLEAAANATKWRLLTPTYRTTVRDMSSAFTAQGDMLLKRAGAKAREARRLVPGAGLYEPLREADLTQADWVAAAAGMEIGAAEIIKQLQVDTAFNLRNPRAVSYLRAHGAELVRGINQTTRDRIRTIVADGASEGASYTEIAHRIDLEFASFSRTGVTDILLDHKGWSRAEVVSIQELSMGYEEGNMAVAADLSAGGLVMEKSWLTVGDDRVSDTCRGNESEGWIAYEDAFSSAHLTAPGHVLCRCCTLYRRKPRG